MRSFTVRAVTGIGEVVEGTDLAGVILGHAGPADGDVVVVTSKVVSKAEGAVVATPKEEAIAEQTDRVVARRGPTSIVRTRHGLVMAAAGVDASNTRSGTVVLLPADPDLSARGLRERIARLGGVDVAVVISDTSGRAWRNGQTDIAVGAAGLEVLDDHAGRVDSYGNPLQVTAPALADELAATGDLAMGKLDMSPIAVITGLRHLVLAPGEHGPGAAALVREEGSDMFGYGAREAVLHAVDPSRGSRGFGAPAAVADLADALAALAAPVGRVVIEPTRVTLSMVVVDPRAAGRLEARADAVARAHGWRGAWSSGGEIGIFSPSTP